MSGEELSEVEAQSLSNVLCVNIDTAEIDEGLEGRN